MSTPPDNKPIRFQSSATNTVWATIQGKRKVLPIVKDGVPVKAGDLKAGQVYVVDKDTGDLVEVAK